MAETAPSRASLLRARALAGDDAAAFDRYSLALGFAPPQRSQSVVLEPGPAAPFGFTTYPPTLTVSRLERAAPPADAHLPPLQARHWAITQQAPLAQPRRDGRPSAQPLKAEDCAPRVPGAQPRYIPLVRMARLWPAVRSTLRDQRAAGIDADALARQLAQARPVWRLPQRSQSTWAETLWIVRDVGDAMQPYADDMTLLLDALIRQRGKAGITVFTLRDAPDQLLRIDSATAGLAQQAPDAARLAAAPPGTRVLLLSHLGALARQPQVRQGWMALLRHWQERGVSALAWVPHSAQWVDVALARALSVHCLQANGHLRPQRGQTGPAKTVAERAAPAVEALLTLAACCIHLGPELLRALRLLHPDLRQEPGLEGLAWTHPWAGRSALSRAPKPEGIAALRERFRALAPALQRQVWLAMLDAHQGRGRTTEATEALIWRSHASADARAPQDEVHFEQARRLFEAFAEVGGHDAEASQFAAELLTRQGRDAHWLREHAPIMAKVHALSGLDEVPPGLDPAEVHRARLRLPHWPARACTLVQRGQALWLWPTAQPLPKPGAPWGGEWQVTEVMVVPASGRARTAHAHQAPCPLAELAPQASPLVLHMGGETLTLSLVQRPAWASEWGRDGHGLYALPPALGDWQPRLDAPLNEAVAAQTPLLAQGVHTATFEPAFAQQRPLNPSSGITPGITPGASLGLGVDELHGIFASLHINSVTQHLRWMPPGEFWMGSSDEERARLRNEQHEKYASGESPRHRVRLSQGFWLADTACTQALWLAVMGGKNPSNFTGDAQCPVEQVSWDQVQGFLQRLQPLLPPGCEAVLPSEAEWEYACRAGTETAFNLGDNVTPEQVNYDGTFPFADGAKGLDRNRTVPVKSLPANTWGLYEMHGNVWEWCRDDLRNYAQTARDEGLVDPEEPPGQEQAAHRAVRGGSWFYLARSARSAARYAYARDDRGAYLGFRLALRSKSPDGPEGPAGGTVGVRPAQDARGPARRDAGPARGGLIDAAKRMLGLGDTPSAKPKAQPKSQPKNKPKDKP